MEGPVPGFAACPAACPAPASPKSTRDVGCGTGSIDDEAADSAVEAFECNICLDLSKEPVVTLCGHLFCWPCLYR